MESQESPRARGLLTRNVLINLAGYGLPMVAALLAMPPLLRGLGEERFGVLTLTWALVSTFGVADLGLGRALTKLVAERLGGDRRDELPDLVGTSLALLSGVGLLSGLVFWGLAPVLVRQLLEIPASLQQETVTGLRLLAFSLPFVILSTGLRGLLEARQRFAAVNAVRIPMGVLALAGPVAVLPFSSSLVPVLAVLGGARSAGFLAYLLLCGREVTWRRPRREAAREALLLGGWMTVHNLLSPLLLYLDRFVIGSLLSLAAVAHYAGTFEVISRLGLIPAAILAVLFPAFSSALAASSGEAPRLYRRSLVALTAGLAPVCVAIALFARPALALWLGEDFAAASFRVAQILALGALINGVAQVPSTLLHAAGRPDLTAKLQLLELPVYCALLVPMIRAYGIEGAAAAFVLRVTVEGAALAWLARRELS